MDATSYNIEKIARYLAEGEKVNASCCAGLELEHFVVSRTTGESVPYFGEQGVEVLLLRLQAQFPTSYWSEEHLIGLETENYHITLEPAGQLEISIRPYASLAQTEAAYAAFMRLLAPLLDECGYRLETKGYQPHSRIDTLPLLPKKRYEWMADYFSQYGHGGLHMMKGTASTQVAVDFSDEADFVLKYRAACVLSPLLALLTENTNPTAYDAYVAVYGGLRRPPQLLRTHIWNQVDTARCLIFGAPFREDFGYEAYARAVYEVPMIAALEELPLHSVAETDRTTLPMRQERDGKRELPPGVLRYVGGLSGRAVYQERHMTDAEVEQLLSMVFPDVRAKHYLELRVADSLPITGALSYQALVKALFSDAASLRELLTFIQTGAERTIDEVEIAGAKSALMQAGARAVIYGKPVAVLAERLLALADAQLKQDDKKYLEPMRARVCALFQPK